MTHEWSIGATAGFREGGVKLADFPAVPSVARGVPRVLHPRILSTLLF
jgi:hypothetical protein